MPGDVESIAPTVLIAQARMRHSEHPSPGFARVTLESPTFEDLDIDGSDTRSTIVFPGATGELPRSPRGRRPRLHGLLAPGRLDEGVAC